MWLGWSESPIASTCGKKLYENQSYVWWGMGKIVKVFKNTPTHEFSPLHLQGTSVARNSPMWSKHMLGLIFKSTCYSIWNTSLSQELAPLVVGRDARRGMRASAADLYSQQNMESPFSCQVFIKPDTSWLPFSLRNWPTGWASLSNELSSAVTQSYLARAFLWKLVEVTCAAVV